MPEVLNKEEVFSLGASKLSVTSWNDTLELLERSFPLVPISCSQLDWYSSGHSARIVDELLVANMCGRTWNSISARQARATSEILFLMSAAAAACLLPGYLIHLCDTEEADTLLDDLPDYLLNVLHTHLQTPSRHFFTPEQTSAISMLFSYLSSYNPGHAEDDVISTWALVSKEYGNLALQHSEVDTF
ncbi:MAG TPA: hypothetical protein PLS15_00060 [Fimbriimonadaceae bacterium]|nr:hypothetical protein [Fimbriimonadaceae bacterium]HRE93189.1 hypothetical protein [Fimbriimonadaceae bacterium]